MRLIDADKFSEELKNLAKGEVPSCPNIADFFVSIRVDRIIDRLNKQPIAFEDNEIDLICKIFQNYYCMGINEIAEEDETAKSLFKKIGLIK